MEQQGCQQSLWHPLPIPPERFHTIHESPVYIHPVDPSACAILYLCDLAGKVIRTIDNMHQ